MQAQVEAARRAAESNPVWYHTIDLAPGVTTPGYVDMRAAATRLLPVSMEGVRALDVGTFDGFWAFEMERRGAEVVAIDLDQLDQSEWPPLQRARLRRRAQELDLELGRGFRIASDALASGVRRVVCNVYDLTAEAIGGPVDFAFFGTLLLHLRDPVRAFERVYATLSAGGEMRLVEPISPALSLLFPRRPVARFWAADSEFNWWVGNPATIAAWARAAGFESVRRLGVLRPPSVREMRQTYVGMSCQRGAGPPRADAAQGARRGPAARWRRRA